MPRKNGRMGDKPPGYNQSVENALRAGRIKAAKERKAALFKAALTDEEVKKRLQLTSDDLTKLDEIIADPSRNAIAQLGALKLKMEYTLQKPEQKVSGDLGVQIVVNTMRKVETQYQIPANTSASGALDGDVQVVPDLDHR